MSKDELIAALEEVRVQALQSGKPRSNGDAHERADALLLKFINDPDVDAAYGKCLPFWYE
jgi:hypothetical protein